MVQPGCITRTRRPASERSGYGAPIFTSDLRAQQDGCEHTGPLRHATGFPGLGPLTSGPPPHPAGISRQQAFPFRPAGCWPEREPRGWFPRSFPNRSTGSAFSYAPATSPQPAPQAFTVASEPAVQTGPRVPHPTIVVRVRVAARPYSASIQPLGCHEELSDAGIFTYAFLSCLPDPDHLAVLIRPVALRAASHPHPSFPEFGLPLASACPLRQTRGGVLSPPHG